MTFRAKFNLVMLVAFLVGLGLSGVFLNTVSERGAKRAVLAEAAAVMGAADATIHYTDQQVSPLLNRQMKAQFLPQSIPFYAAQQTFQLMASAFPDYAFSPANDQSHQPGRPARAVGGRYHQEAGRTAELGPAGGGTNDEHRQGPVLRAPGSGQ